MKTAIVRLDDVGAQGPAQIRCLVARSLSTMTPLCIGLRGLDLERMHADLVLLLQLAMKVGVIEIWNHGYLGTFPLDDEDASSLEDVIRGHQIALSVLGAEPSGYAFRGGFSARLAALLEKEFPDQIIFDSDLSQHTYIPLDSTKWDKTKDWFEEPAALSDIVLHARVSNWSEADFVDLDKRIARAIDFGYLPVSTLEARALNKRTGSNVASHIRDLSNLKDQLVAHWTANQELFSAHLPNFESYYLSRFASDTEKNFFQLQRALFPQRPQKILDIGCGLGNWSLGFALSGTAKSLILNDVDATIAKALRDGVHSIGLGGICDISEEDLLARSDEPKTEVDCLVCANTFNYLDPVKFFQLARNSIEIGGILFLMVQTSAFNKMRYRGACRTRNRSVAAEVLRSELGMVLRRMGILFPVGIRHIFDRTEISALAQIFGFVPQSSFVPSGENRVDGSPVYECYIFRRAADLIDASDCPLSNSLSAMDHSFGPRAKEISGISPTSLSSLYPKFDDPWSLPDTPANKILLGLKDALGQLQRGVPSTFVPAVAVEHPGINDVAKKLNKFVQVLNSNE